MHISGEEFYPYVYPIGGLILGLITLLIYWRRPDLRKMIVLMSFILLPFATIAEYLFFKDYWFPPDFIDFNIGPFRIIAGDIIMVITTPPIFVTGIPFLLNYQIQNIQKINYRKLGIKIFAAQGILTLIYFALWYITDLNSIWCYSLACLLLALIILAIQRNSFMFGIYCLGILAMGFGTFLFYLLYQLVIGDDYLQSVWLLDHSKYSIAVLDRLIPLTEVAFGALVAPFYFLLVFVLESKLRLVKNANSDHPSS